MKWTYCVIVTNEGIISIRRKKIGECFHYRGHYFPYNVIYVKSNKQTVGICRHHSKKYWKRVYTFPTYYKAYKFKRILEVVKEL